MKDFVFFGVSTSESDALKRVLNERWEVLWPGRAVVGINADGSKLSLLNLEDTGDDRELEQARARACVAGLSALHVVLALRQLENDLIAHNYRGPPAALVCDVVQKLGPDVAVVLALLEGRS